MSEDLTKKLPTTDSEVGLIFKDIFGRISVISDLLVKTQADLVDVKERLHGLEQKQQTPAKSQT